MIDILPWKCFNSSALIDIVPNSIDVPYCQLGSNMFFVMSSICIHLVQLCCWPLLSDYKRVRKLQLRLQHIAARLLSLWVQGCILIIIFCIVVKCNALLSRLSKSRVNSWNCIIQKVHNIGWLGCGNYFALTRMKLRV